MWRLVARCWCWPRSRYSWPVSRFAGWRLPQSSSVGTFTASAISDRSSRKTVMQIGVIITTFLTLLVPLAQSGTQLIIIRVLTGFGAGFAVTASFPIAAELMPKQHRRTFGAIYEVMLASAFTLLPSSATCSPVTGTASG